MQKILIVENDQELADGLKMTFAREKLESIIVATLDEAFDKFYSTDMMIIDYKISEHQSEDFLQNIINENNKYPVLFLLADVSEEELPSTASDYIISPFTTAELRFRVMQILKRKEWYKKSISIKSLHTFGKCRIDFNTMDAITRRGRKKLSPVECYVMKYLIENMNRPVKYRELLENIWGVPDLEENEIVDGIIRELRKYFEEEKAKHVFLRTIPGQGFRFFNT